MQLEQTVNQQSHSDVDRKFENPLRYIRRTMEDNQIVTGPIRPRQKRVPDPIVFVQANRIDKYSDSIIPGQKITNPSQSVKVRRNMVVHDSQLQHDYMSLEDVAEKLGVALKTADELLTRQPTKQEWYQCAHSVADITHQIVGKIGIDQYIQDNSHNVQVGALALATYILQEYNAKKISDMQNLFRDEKVREGAKSTFLGGVLKDADMEYIIKEGFSRDEIYTVFGAKNGRTKEGLDNKTIEKTSKYVELIKLADEYISLFEESKRVPDEVFGTLLQKHSDAHHQAILGHMRAAFGAKSYILDQVGFYGGKAQGKTQQHDGQYHPANEHERLAA